MVDDFMVCVDRIIASACFETANEEGYTNSGNDDRRVGRGVEREENRCENGNGEGSSKKNNKGEMIECRICQEEDEEQAMEAPCACNGTLKFAHRKCIQRWCNKKGDITCEICNQVYSPNYSLSPARPASDGMAIDIRQSWGQHINLHDPRILALAAAEHRLLQAEYEDYAAANSGGLTCCRSVALILMLLLLIRHALMLTKDAGLVQDVSTFFNVSILQFAAFLLPCYVMARAIYILQSRRRRQG